MIYSRQKKSELIWRENDQLKQFLSSSNELLLVELSRLLQSSSCSIDTLRICLALSELLYELQEPTEKEGSFEEWLMNLFTSHCCSFSSLLQSISYTTTLYATLTSTTVSFLRKMLPLIETKINRFNPFIINKNSIAFNIWRLQPENLCLNSIHIGDEENTGLYDLSKGVMMSEIPLIFGKTVHYHLMVYFYHSILIYSIY